MKKNGLCLLLALALMLGLFAGCSNNQQGDEPSAPPAKTDEPATPPADNEPADPAAGEVTLTFWTPTWRQAAEEPVHLPSRQILQGIRRGPIDPFPLAKAVMATSSSHSSSFVPLSGRPIRAIRRSQPRGLPGVA